MSTQATKPPKPLRSEDLTTRIVREEIWKPANLQNDWRTFAVVGRESSGKSLTCASILSAVDPTFGVDNAHFRAVPFLQDVADEAGQPGQALMSDESGVAFGNRTWHDREQIEANQALQTARDGNKIIGITAPRLEEIDSQLQGRLHHLLECVRKKDGEWVEVKWKKMDPSRSGQGTIYKKYPRRTINGRKCRVTRLKIGPPPDQFIQSYQEKKAEWKEGLYDRVIANFQEQEEEEEPDLSPKDIVSDILENDKLDDYISSYNNREFIDNDLIAADYEIGDRRSKKVKKLLGREVDGDVS